MQNLKELVQLAPFAKVRVWLGEIELVASAQDALALVTVFEPNETIQVERI